MHVATETIDTLYYACQVMHLHLLLNLGDTIFIIRTIIPQY